MKRRKILLVVAFILLVTIDSFGSTDSIVLDINAQTLESNEEDIKRELYLKEDQLNIISDLVKYFTNTSDDLFNNTYYSYMNKEKSDIKKNHQKEILDIYITEYPEVKDLLNNNLKLELFSKIDKNLISKDNSLNTIRGQKKVFEEVLLKSRDYYIKTSKGVKLYPESITEFNNNLQTAIKNREDILNNKYIDYDSDYFYSKVSIEDGDLINRRLTDEEILINFYTSLEVYNFIDINPVLLKDLEVYMTPFSLNGLEAYTFLGESTRRGPYESIYLAHKTDMDTFNKESIEDIKSTALHELGHIIEGRTAFKDLGYNIFNHYEQLTFKPKKEHASNKPYYVISGYELKDSPEDDNNWEESLSENFAEHFKHFMSDKLPEHLKFISKDTLTIFEYNSKIENLFKNILEVEEKPTLEKVAFFIE